MKVLIVSDYPYIIERSGYATQTLNLLNKLIDGFFLIMNIILYQ